MSIADNAVQKCRRHYIIAMMQLSADKGTAAHPDHLSVHACNTNVKDGAARVLS